MALTGNEVLEVTGVQANGMPSGQTLLTTTEAIAQLANLSSATEVITALNTVGAGTITAAAITGRHSQRGGAQASAAFTDTTDTANAVIALLPASAGTTTSWTYTYANLTNAVATLAGGSGVTISVCTVIPPNSWAEYLFTYTATSTLTMVGIDQGYFPNIGSFTITGATAVTVSNTAICTTSVVVITLKTVGGTVGAVPVIKTITSGTGFTVTGITADTSIYSYTILG